MKKRSWKLLAVVTSAAWWPHFNMLAKSIQEEADRRGYVVMFLNLQEEYGRLQTFIEQLKADGYLISRRIVTGSHRNDMIMLRKPVAFLDDHIVGVNSEGALQIPHDIIEQTVTAVTYVCV